MAYLIDTDVMVDVSLRSAGTANPLPDAQCVSDTLRHAAITIEEAHTAGRGARVGSHGRSAEAALQASRRVGETSGNWRGEDHPPRQTGSRRHVLGRV